MELLSIQGFALIFFVGCPIVVAVASGAGYALSRVLIRINWIRPSRIGDSPAEQARHRAVQILYLHCTRAAAGFVIAFVAFFFVGSFFVAPIAMVLIQAGGDSKAGYEIALLIAMALVHAPAQLVAYWLSVRHALWLG